MKSEKQREATRRWRVANPEKRREANRRYNLAHREQRREKDREFAADRRGRLDAIKLERGCVDCGFNGHPAALDFDHLPGSDKAGVISGMRTHLWSKVLAEIAKCEVVCSNCHRIRTAERGQYRDRSGVSVANVTPSLFGGEAS